MTAAKRRKFIRELIRNVQADILSKTDRMPDEWDGIELREYIADKFDDAKLASTSMRRKRLHEYHNSVIINNL